MRATHFLKFLPNVEKFQDRNFPSFFYKIIIVLKKSFYFVNYMYNILLLLLVILTSSPNYATTFSKLRFYKKRNYNKASSLIRPKLSEVNNDE